MQAIARLLVKAPYEGLLYLRPGRFVIGRHRDCDLIVDCQEVSRHHVVLEVAPTSVRLLDQGSRNGTRVDGEPTDQCLLDQGSRVQIGPVTCVFEWLESFASRDDYPTPAADLQDGGERTLTPAEHRVLNYLLEGLAEKAIAAKLDLSRHTIHNHIKKIYSSCRVNSRSELLARFIRSKADVVPSIRTGPQ